MSKSVLSKIANLSNNPQARARLLLLAPWGVSGLLVVALLARWDGSVWIESLALGGALAVVYGFAALGLAGDLIRKSLWPAALLSAWLVLFAGTLTTFPDKPAKPVFALVPTLPARKVLHAYGPLSVVVDREWSRLIQPPPERHVLVVTDGVALTFSAEPFPLGDASDDLAASADEIAKAICDEEGFRVLDTWNGAAHGFATAERALVKGEHEAYCLVVVTERDGYRIVARGDTFDDFRSRDVIGELRRISASLRAMGVRRDEPAALSDPTEQEKPL